MPEVDAQYVETIKPLLSDIDHLSVREITAANIVQNAIGVKPSVVLDPTLLMTKEEWRPLANESVSNGGYIFLYSLFNSESLWDFAYKLSEKTGLPIKTVSYSKFHRHAFQGLQMN